MKDTIGEGAMTERNAGGVDGGAPWEVVPTPLVEAPLIPFVSRSADGEEHRPPGLSWATAELAPGGGVRELRCTVDGRTWIAESVLLASGSLTLQALADSPAVDALGNPVPADAAIVVLSTEGSGVAGVLCGEDLVEVLHAARVRAIVDSDYPSVLGIEPPLINRQCHFTHSGTRCGVVLTVEERPATLPMCEGTQSVPWHGFVW